MVKLFDSSRATIVLLVIAVFVVIAAGLSILTNNAVLASIVGVIVGATFAIIGNIVNVTWLDPLKRKQDREERQGERGRELSDKNTNLRRALYGEIISLASTIGPDINTQRNLCGLVDTDYLKSTEKGKLRIPLTFRVYDSLKTDPVAFYQLEDASDIDSAYDRLRFIDNLLQVFSSTSFDTAEKAREKCAALINAYKRILSVIDRVVFDQHSRILEDLDDGRLIKSWDELKSAAQVTFGSLPEITNEF